MRDAVRLARIEYKYMTLLSGNFAAGPCSAVGDPYHEPFELWSYKMANPKDCEDRYVSSRTAIEDVW